PCLATFLSNYLIPSFVTFCCTIGIILGRLNTIKWAWYLSLYDSAISLFLSCFFGWISLFKFCRTDLFIRYNSISNFVYNVPNLIHNRHHNILNFFYLVIKSLLSRVRFQAFQLNMICNFVFTKGIWTIINIVTCQRIHIKKSPNIRLMISPFERVPIQSQIIYMLLALEFPTIGHTIFTVVTVERQPEGIVIIGLNYRALDMCNLQIIKEHIHQL